MTNPESVSPSRLADTSGWVTVGMYTVHKDCAEGRKTGTYVCPVCAPLLTGGAK